MYDTIVMAISSGNYRLDEMAKKIDLLYGSGRLTETERSRLLALCMEKLSIESERPAMQVQLEALAARVTELETAVAELKGSVSGGDAAYPAWTAWDGMSTNYQQGAVVSHNGKLWESTYAGQNVWEPGVIGTESLWSEYTE